MKIIKTFIPFFVLFFLNSCMECKEKDLLNEKYNFVNDRLEFYDNQIKENDNQIKVLESKIDSLSLIIQKR